LSADGVRDELIQPVVCCGFAHTGQLEAVRYLMDIGARVHGQELLLAIEKGHEEVVRLLLSRGVDANNGPNLARAVLRNNVPIGTTSCCACVSTCDCLSHAWLTSNTPARLLLEHGARESINVVGLHGAKDPPLHVAVSKSYHEMVKLLLANGADPRLQSRYPQQPHSAQLALTVVCGIPNRDRQTAVSLAQGNRAILATLLQHEQKQQQATPTSTPDE
jgi:ankyrin repeat protein